MFLEALMVSTLLLGSVELLALPSYITPCSLSDPAFEKCALSAAKNFLQRLKEGDKDLKIPPLDDVKFPDLFFNNSRDISINITNPTVAGIATMTFLNLKKVPSKNRIEFTTFASPIVTGNFIINAKVGGATLAASGPGTWKWNNLVGDIGFEWQPKEKDGVTYTDITNVDATLRVEDPKLVIDVDPGDNLNELLSQNIHEIINEIRPSTLYYTKRVFSMFTNALFTSVPYNELFLE